MEILSIGNHFTASNSGRLFHLTSQMILSLKIQFILKTTEYKLGVEFPTMVTLQDPFIKWITICW